VLDGPLPNRLLQGNLQKYSQTYCEEIEKSRGKRFEDKFISWLSRKVEVKNYRAKIKFAPEMRI
jgi:hypothetical protein